MTLAVKFHIEDETFSIVKILTDMQIYDCSIEVPILITNLYGFSLVISKTSEFFSKKKSPLPDFYFSPLMGQGLK